MYLWLDCNGALGTHGCLCVLFRSLRQVHVLNFASSNIFCSHFVTCMHWSCAFLPTKTRWSTTKDGLLLVGSPRRSFGCSYATVLTEYEMCVVSTHPWLLIPWLIPQLLPMVFTHFTTQQNHLPVIILTMEEKNISHTRLNFAKFKLDQLCALHLWSFPESHLHRHVWFFVRSCLLHDSKSSLLCNVNCRVINLVLSTSATWGNSYMLHCIYALVLKSQIYYMECSGRPWQYYVKGSYTPPVCVISVPLKPQLLSVV